jgi:uncharacterized protein (UPF0261 family)
VSNVYVVGTCDTKLQELQYVKAAVAAAGVPALLVDVGTARPVAQADVTAEEVARRHPVGRGAVLGLDDRGRAVSAMGEALAAFLCERRDDVGGVIGLGGGGNTALVTHGMRALPVGVPKVMVSTVASGDVRPYLGASDICMMPSITDVAGLNRINRRVLANAAHAIAGMAMQRPEAAGDGRPTIGLTQFGVTTACIDQVRARLDPACECMVFHATGIGGQTMEKLADSGLLQALLDITTTEVADLLVGGVLACTDDRFGALRRTRIPAVLSCGALDMVNFGPRASVPAAFDGRRFHMHNPQVTLMRTTPEENERIGRWIAQRLNACEGELVFLVPERGVSALDAPGMPFYDPAADRALFDALEKHWKPSPRRALRFLPLHINDPAFASAVSDAFEATCVGRSIATPTSATPSSPARPSRPGSCAASPSGR